MKTENKLKDGEGSDASTCSVPFTLPLKVVSEFTCGTDAHIVDADGSVVIARSEWNDKGQNYDDRRHIKAMNLISETLNDKFL